MGFGQKANFTVLAAMPPKAPKAKKKSPPSGKKNGKKKVAVEAAETTAGFVDNEKPEYVYNRPWSESSSHHWSPTAVYRT